MVQVTENAVIKKAPAKKAPRVETEAQEATLDIESIALENQERIDKVVDNTKILSTNLKEYTKRLDSMHEKSDKLSDKLTFVNDANCTIMFPNHLIESVINKQIEKVNNKLMNSIDEAQEVVNELSSEDVKDALDQVNRINDLKNRICDIEDTINNSNLDDLEFEIECQVDGILDYKDYIVASDVDEMVEDAINSRDYVEREDLHEDLKIYGREINELRERLNNTIYNKIVRLVKSIFSYNLANKVRSIFKRNKNKAHTTMSSKK